LAYIGNFKSQTTLAIFVVEAGGYIQINQQTQELNTESLYWITLDQDEQIEFNGMHVMLIEMECST
jgi:hypothetical protein